MAKTKGRNILLTLAFSILLLFNIAALPTVPVWLINSSKVRDVVQHSSFKETLDFYGKLELVGKYTAYIGLLFVVLTLLVMSARGITSSPSPVVQSDSILVDSFNRGLINSLEEAAIFVPNYLYWALAYSSKRDAHLIAALPLVWIIGRVLFTLGYVAGIPIGLSNLRGFGKSVSFGISIFLVLRNIEFLAPENALWEHIHKAEKSIF